MFSGGAARHMTDRVDPIRRRNGPVPDKRAADVKTSCPSQHRVCCVPCDEPSRHRRMLTPARREALLTPAWQ